jgi:homoserine dehydrogenase
VQIEGIRGITVDDVQSASELGYIIKHVATAELAGDAVTLQVRPVLLPHAHQLAAVRDENNAVLVRGDAIGEMLFSGKGAGSLAGASAVLSDIGDIACHRGGFASTPNGTVLAGPPGKSSRYYLRFPVPAPSAIGAITTILERSGVPVARSAAIWAKHPMGQNQMRVLTHQCAGPVIKASLDQVGKLTPSTSGSIALQVLS